MSKARHYAKARARRYRIEDKERGKTRPHAIHVNAHPAGAKLILRFYKARNGVKADSYAEALKWWKNYNPGRL